MVCTTNPHRKSCMFTYPILVDISSSTAADSLRLQHRHRDHSKKWPLLLLRLQGHKSKLGKQPSGTILVLDLLLLAAYLLRENLSPQPRTCQHAQDVNASDTSASFGNDNVLTKHVVTARARARAHGHSQAVVVGPHRSVHRTHRVGVRVHVRDTHPVLGGGGLGKPQRESMMYAS